MALEGVLKAFKRRVGNTPLLRCTELEERLTGNVEYTSQELVGPSFHFNGRGTWIYDAATQVAVWKPYRALMEPVPGISTFGELEFLRDLTRDFLIREQEDVSSDRPSTRVLVLKPKTQVRHHLLKSITFAIHKATVTFDQETLFPVRIRVVPIPGSLAHTITGETGSILIEYNNVRLIGEDETSPPFFPPESARVFREESLPAAKIIQRVPFPLSVRPFVERGYEPVDQQNALTIDEANGRAYATLMLTPKTEEERAAASYMVLRVGNYLSRNMARRRVTLSEKGEEHPIHGHPARYLDRRSLWNEHLPEAEASHAPEEWTWEHEGVFWFLAGFGVGEQKLRGIVEAYLGQEGSKAT